MATPEVHKKIIIKSTSDIANILIEEMSFEEKEITKLVILSNKNEILKIKDIAIRRRFINKSCNKRYI